MIEYRKNDPIMKEIEKEKEKYEIAPVNAEIKENVIIPGSKGISVDIEKSYHKMKKYGSYNESLTVLKEINPVISINSNYKNYIEKGNKTKRNISIIFIIDDHSPPEEIISIIEKENIRVTFFIDGSILDKYSSFIKKYNNHEYEILSFNHNYNSSFLKTSRSYLESITNTKSRYCYTEKENKELLKDCSKNHLHTIKPINIYEENILYNTKKDLENGSIISIKIGDNSKKELSTMIRFIKQKGYSFTTIRDLLTE